MPVEFVDRVLVLVMLGLIVYGWVKWPGATRTGKIGRMVGETVYQFSYLVLLVVGLVSMVQANWEVQRIFIVAIIIIELDEILHGNELPQ